MRPAGGTVSPVNGQFYNGGEFIPDTGAYCGKGKNKVSRDEFARVAAAVAATGRRLEYRESTGEFVVFMPTGNVYVRAARLATIARAFPGNQKISLDTRADVRARMAAAVAAFNAGDPFGWDAYLEARAELDS